MLIAGLAFAVVFAIVFVPYWAFVARTEEREERALRKRLKIRRKVALRPIVKAQAQIGALGHLDALVMRGRSVIAPLEQSIDQAGFKVTVETVVLASGFIAVAAFFLVSMLTSSVLLALAISVLSASLPVLYIRGAARKRELRGGAADHGCHAGAALGRPRSRAALFSR